MSQAVATDRPRTSVPALAAFVLGVAGLACIPSAWIAAAVLGAVAIVVALRTRPAFRRDDRLRGAGFAGVGFVLGVIALALGLWPLVFQALAGALG